MFVAGEPDCSSGYCCCDGRPHAHAVYTCDYALGPRITDGVGGEDAGAEQFLYLQLRLGRGDSNSCPRAVYDDGAVI